MIFRRTLFGRPKALWFNRGMKFGWEKVPVALLQSVAIVDRDESRNWTATLAAGAIGGALLGPAGAIGGMLGTSKKDETIARVTFAGGRGALVQATREEIKVLLGAAMTNMPYAASTTSSPSQLEAEALPTRPVSALAKEPLHFYVSVTTNRELPSGAALSVSATNESAGQLDISSIRLSYKQENDAKEVDRPGAMVGAGKRIVELVEVDCSRDNGRIVLRVEVDFRHSGMKHTVSQSYLVDWGWIGRLLRSEAHRLADER